MRETGATRVRSKYTEFTSECLNCGPTRRIIIKGRCDLCYNYLRVVGQERPLTVSARVAPTWEPFRAEEARPNDSIWCDCGKLATWALTVPSSQRGKTTLLLCDACAALERRLAPVHSWKGG